MSNWDWHFGFMKTSQAPSKSCMTAARYVADLLTSPYFFKSSSTTDEPTLYMIIPSQNSTRDSRIAFTQRLNSETDPNILFITREIPEFEYLGNWQQFLTPREVEIHRKDPTVGSHLTKSLLDTF
jgi:hypothetical protein